MRDNNINSVRFNVWFPILIIIIHIIIANYIGLTQNICTSGLNHRQKVKNLEAEYFKMVWIL
jgi:hypothetical protein